jgi:ComF family protein
MEGSGKVFRICRQWLDNRHQPDCLTRVYDWPGIIQNLIYPPTCLLCGDPGADDRDLCQLCAAALPYLESACPVCGLPLAVPAQPSCGACQKQPPPFDRMVAAFHYEEPARHLIHSLKFGARYANARLLGSLLADRVTAAVDRPEVIMPVPLHPVRYRERGFNQSLEIARVLSQQTGIPLDCTACRRIRPTAPQTRLQADERRKNLRQAFGVMQPLTATHLAIVDDVVTTTATVGDMAKVLRRAGAQRIQVWACARA